jgi:hypothetical protein
MKPLLAILFTALLSACAPTETADQERVRLWQEARDRGEPAQEGSSGSMTGLGNH